MAVIKGPFYQSLFKYKCEKEKTGEVDFVYEQTPTFDDIVRKIRVLLERHRLSCLVIIGPIIPRSVSGTAMDPVDLEYEKMFASFFEKINLLNIPNTFYVNDIDELTSISPIPVALDDELSPVTATCLPNPTVLNLGGLSIGFTNSDTFGKMRRECLVRGFADEKKIYQIIFQQIMMSKTLQPMTSFKTGYDLSKYLQMDLKYLPQIIMLNSNGIDELISVEQHDLHFVNLHSFIKKSRYGSFALVKYDGSKPNPLAIDIYSTPTD